MSELELYQRHPEAWVFFLADKYLKAHRYKQLLIDFKAALPPEKLEAAREMWRKDRNG